MKRSISFRLATTTVVAATLFLSTRHAFADIQYRITDLGTLVNLKGNSSSAHAINASGEIVGGATVSTGYIHAFLYTNGAMSDLGTLSGMNYSDAYGINSTGQIVGWSYTSSRTGHAFIYSAGKMTDLGTLGGTTSYACGINASGQVVGYTYTSSGAHHAFLYSGGQMTDLGTLGGDFSTATAINDSGQIVGYSTTSSGLSHAFLYSNGQMTDLSALTHDGIRSAYGINNSGTIVGDDGQDAVIYSGGTVVNLGRFSIASAVAYGINASNQVTGDGGVGDPFIYDTTGPMTSINTLIPTSPHWDLTNAYAINDLGQIVGYGINSNKQQDAFLATPIPEPASLGILGLGLAGLIICRRVRGIH